jgi:hypothetical protein
MTLQATPISDVLPALQPTYVSTFSAQYFHFSIIIPTSTVIPGHPVFVLKCDIMATVEYAHDGVIISAPFFDEEGYGETYKIAWNDFLTSIRDRYVSMKKREDRLSPFDRKILHRLQQALI